MTRSLKTLERRTKEIYNDHAVAFDNQRDKSLFERKWLDVFWSHLDGLEILDLGCGTGEPVSEYLISKGAQFTGVDFSDRMVEMARSRFPNQEWIVADMRELNIGRCFDGIISWNGFFHLNPDDQHIVLSTLSDLLHPKGIMLLTVGHEKGQVTGIVNGQLVAHFSCSFEEYREMLSGLGFELLYFVSQDPECQQHTILMARKLESSR